MNGDLTVDVIIPVYKPDGSFLKAVRMLEDQTHRVRKIILMETESEVPLPDLSCFDNIEIHRLQKRDFDHGGTRKTGVSFSDADYVLLMTQDAVPEDRLLIERLLSVFSEPDVAASYACQKPKEDCTPEEAYTRAFNYPAVSRIKSSEDLPVLGIKTFFCSNVCAMYDRKVMESCGGFPERAIFNEDMIFASRLIHSGYRIAYVSEAAVLHSHNLTGREQFRRNFDLGVSQAQNTDIFDAYPAEKEGGSMVLSVIGKLLKNGYIFRIPAFIYRCGMRYLGYRAGRRYRTLSKKRILSYTMNPTYWEDHQDGTD